MLSNSLSPNNFPGKTAVQWNQMVTESSGGIDVFSFFLFFFQVCVCTGSHVRIGKSRRFKEMFLVFIFKL